MTSGGRRGAGLVAAALVAACAQAPPPKSTATVSVVGTRAPEIATKVAGLERREGLLDLYVDAAQGKLLAVLPAPSGPRGRIAEYLYVEGIATGLGSNPIGLDRGQLGESRVLAVRRAGSRVLFEEPNPRFRALSGDRDEVAAVRESFATSVHWAGEIVGEDPDGRLLVDLTGFALRDAHGSAARIAAAGQGSFSLDRERSALELGSCLAFPRNVELEAVLTFAGSGAGPEIAAIAPDPTAVTLVQRQSLIELPPAGYRPRELDPRMGSFAIEFADYAAPLAAPITRRWIVRHRLEKTEPSAALSPVREPIVYYVDRGAPEPVRSALLEGAGWWAQAFEAAGFRDAFRVELLPEDAHPLDVRYNVIQWVHRATRGWSYGGGVIDPRSGEMIKGHVTLGSLRVRQDRLLFEGLVGADASGRGGAGDPVQVALARIRQLAAHEVGHTLGLAHNFAASSFGRASVMDYPAPLVRVTPEGELDLSQAYAAGVGAWDLAAVRWAYAETPPGADEAAALEAIVRETLDRGLYFLGDADARASDTAHPAASLWDNGADPVTALQQTLRVRRIALSAFGERSIARGRPIAELEEVFVPVYLHHRYQLAAAAKLVGGLDYRHAVRGDGQPPPQPVAGERQRRAIDVVLETLSPGFLDVPESALRLLVPRAPDQARTRELFPSRTLPAFDALGAAASAADLPVRLLLDPSRAARLVDQHRRTGTTPDFAELLSRLVEATFLDHATLSPREAEIARTVERVVVDRLEELSGDVEASPAVRARADAALSGLLQRLDAVAPLAPEDQAHYDALVAEVGRHLARPAPPREPSRAAPAPPPGEPIGAPDPALGEGGILPGSTPAVAEPFDEGLGACGWAGG